VVTWILKGFNSKMQKISFSDNLSRTEYNAEKPGKRGGLTYM
jgi:hypothetical protein